ncbi:MAG: tryptophan synthase subunit alpha [Deltaproteobacteria bacterium]|nr:tryptophan synthase subunit alpha [Deltaproteobacteria bacterium]
MLERYLKQRLEEKPMLLMTHIVVGYPSFEASMDLVREMVTAGVDLMELQIPFSEPIADGPVILRANQKALHKGATVERCLEFAAEAASRFHIPFLIMTYYNILFKYGVEHFVSRMGESGLKGAIVPDLPPEEGNKYLDAMKAHALCPILIYSPTTSFERMQYLNGFGEGFIYCVARKGVTGAQTAFSEGLDDYLKRCRIASKLPLAVGFGVSCKSDVDYLSGKADIAVIGTQTLRIMEKAGVAAVGKFISELRP